MKDLATQFRALADPTRLAILGLVLRHGELCVCDFVAVLDITQSKASRHLRYLANAGLLADRREAVWSYYRIPDSLDCDRERLLACAREVLTEERMHRLDEKMELRRERASCDNKLVKLQTADTEKDDDGEL